MNGGGGWLCVCVDFGVGVVYGWLEWMVGWRVSGGGVYGVMWDDACVVCVGEGVVVVVVKCVVEGRAW